MITRRAANIANTAGLEKGIQLVRIVADGIKELGRVPSGHLYAMVMAHLSFEQYTQIIDTLKNAGLIEEKSFELFWIAK